MERAIQALVEVAHTRNILIPKLLSSDSVYTPINPSKTEEARGTLGRFFSRFSLRGGENIQHALDLAAAGNKITVVDKHTNELDIIARRLAMEQAGFEGVMDRWVYPVEIEWAETPDKQYWLDGEHTVYTMPPQDLEELDQGLKTEGLDEGIIDMLKRYKGHCTDLTRAALAKLTALCNRTADQQPSMMLALYPEADFQRDGFLRRAPVGVSRLFSHRDGEYILPVLTSGQEQLGSLTEPMEDEWKPGVRVIVGKPYPSRLVWDNRKKGEVEPVDLVMASIARLDPTIIHPEHISFYDPLIAA